MEEPVFNKFLVNAHAYCLPKLIRLTDSKVDAEDAFMEAVYVLWKDLNSGKIKHRDNLKGLVYVMAKNLFLMTKRKATRGNTREYATDPSDLKILEAKAKKIQQEEEYDVLLKAENEQSELKDRLQKEVAFKMAFEKLGEKCQQLLTKFIVEKVRLKVIKDLLGFPSVDAVKMTKYRCKKNLVKAYKERTNR